MYSVVNSIIELERIHITKVVWCLAVQQSKIDTRTQKNMTNECANHGWCTKQIWKESSPTQTVFAAAVYSNIMDCSLHVLYISLCINMLCVCQKFLKV